MESSQAMRMLCDNKWAMAMQLSDEDEEKPLCLKDVGDLSDELYDQANNNADLDRAIAAYEAAVRLTPDGHQCRAELLSQLGISLWKRFEYFGDVADIDNAIFVLEGSLLLTPDGHTDRPGRLNPSTIRLRVVSSVLVTWLTLTGPFPLTNEL
jgi:hypothetical protein